MKRLVVDLDGTLTLDESALPYADKEPNRAMIAKLRTYRAEGYEIVIATARSMRSFNCNVGRINAETLPAIIDWLRRHDVPYDEIHVGKPWCGTQGFYIDDKALRPDEFLKMSHDEIARLLGLGAEAN